jgi:soluble cytochrome b562
MLTIMGLFAGGALWSLVWIPQSRECPRILRPFSSASFKLYCAQMAASKGTTEGYIQAIDLVKSLPIGHPLQQNVDQELKKWAFDLVILAQEQFNKGELPRALETLKVIPLDRLPCDSHQCPRKEIEHWGKDWQAIWDQGQNIVQEVEKALMDQNWDAAAAAATKLLSIENRYWQVNRYNELNAQITEVRSTNSLIGQAKKLADQGGADNLAQAIQLVSQVQSNSRLYSIAQAQISRYGEQMLKLAQDALERKNLDSALKTVDKIPAVAGRKQQVEDFKFLANIQAKTWSGQVSDYQAAINDLRQVSNNRSVYTQAQRLILRWEQEISDLQHLDQARTLAKTGTITGYMSAIAEVSLVPQANPRYGEAQNLIKTWNGEIQMLEDAPYLERARRLATGGTVPALEAAITEANRIQPKRRLYDDAQAAILGWQQDIQRVEDQPTLDEAQRLANAGRLSEAIALVQRISPGRALYDNAQKQIKDWQLQINAEYSLQQANGLGSASRTPEGLTAAIRAADQVPDRTPQRQEANSQIDRWSADLLQMAIERSQYDPVGAIDIANGIPPESSSYAEAQSYIQSWRSQPR